MNANNLSLEESFEDGKYTIQIDKNGHMVCLRYGETWRDLTGDKLISAMAHEVESLRDELKASKEKRNTKAPSPKDRKEIKEFILKAFAN